MFFSLHFQNRLNCIRGINDNKIEIKDAPREIERFFLNSHFQRKIVQTSTSWSKGRKKMLNVNGNFPIDE